MWKVGKDPWGPKGRLAGALLQLVPRGSRRGRWSLGPCGPREEVRRELMGKMLFSFTYKYDERGSIEEIS